MASLYNISEDILRIFEDIENSDGELTEEQEQELTIKEEELKEKLNNYVKAIKEFQKDADFCKKEKQSINDRQNVYKNRIENLKKAMLQAVIRFGEDGKNNKFIELPCYRIFTKSSKSVQVNEERINIFITEFERYIRELVNNGVLYTGQDVDLQGILEAINANVIAEQGEDFQPFTISDLTAMNISITTTASIYELFRNHNNALIEYANNPNNCKIINNTSKEDWTTYINVAKDNNLIPPTMAEIIINNSIQIK